MSTPRISRREAIGSMAVLAAAGPSALAIKPKPNPYEECARDAVKWIRAQAVETEHGLAWPAIPGKKETISPDLYSGTAGVVLLLAGAGRRWKDRSMVDRAKEGVPYLRFHAEQRGTDRGLYTGRAGMALALLRLGDLSSDDAVRSFGWRGLWHAAAEHGYMKGIGQLPTVNDVISGVAGLGLAFMECPHPALDYDAQAAEDLLKRGALASVGIRWPLDENYPRDLPNFSHGTAGVAFFFAKVYARYQMNIDDPNLRMRYLVAAEKGANYLLSIANLEKGGCLIYHADPDGKNRYYLGWCHGPAGTSQLWWQLAKATGDRKWEEYAHRGAQSLLDLGVPEKRTEGYWNNDGLCCGTAGIGRFFLDMYRRSGQKRYWDAAERCAQVILKNAVRDEQGARWVHAEHRVLPQEVYAQTGWMQGAAGIAAFLIEMTSPKKAVFRLPVDAD